MNRFAIFILTLVLNNISAQTIKNEDLRNIKKVIKIGKTIDKYGEIAYNAIENYNECMVFHNSEDYCSKAATICAEYDLATSAIPSVILQATKAMESFRPYCGNGKCFQCCFLGDNCATSFIGFPVINCNKNYGPLTRPAGITLVTDTNPTPGQPCLFTSQTCDHVPLCNSKLNPNKILAINNDPTHIMKSNLAKSQRALVFADNTLNISIQNLLNTYNQNINALNLKYSDINPHYSDIGDFIFSRGDESWLRFNKIISDSKNIKAFEVVDTLSNEVLVHASKQRMYKYLMLARYLKSIPNLIERLNFVESKIWTSETKNAYVPDTLKVDSIFLSQISPLALNMLRDSMNGLQDYRLLSVSLPGESIIENNFNGIAIGNPPEFTSNFSNDKLSIKLVNYGNHDPLEKMNYLILWGDGCTNIVSSLGNIDLEHKFKDKGLYKLIIIAQNSAGLRSIEFKDIDINIGKTHNNTPAIHSIKFENLTAQTGVVRDIYFKYLIKTTDDEFLLGKSEVIDIPFQSILIDTVAYGINPTLRNSNQFIIKPMYKKFMGKKQSTLSFTKLKIGLFDTDELLDNFFEVPFDKLEINFFDFSGKELDRNKFLTSISGLHKMHIFLDTFRVEKIVITISQDFLNGLLINSKSVLNNKTIGQFFEIKPDIFEIKSKTTNVVINEQAETKIRVYPNPVFNSLFIHRSDYLDRNAILDLFNSNGSLIKKINFEKNQDHIEIDVSNFTQSMYYFLFNDGLNIKSGKFLKL